MAEKSNDVNFTSELLGKIHGPVFGTHAAKFAEIAVDFVRGDLAK